jgi:predicted TPR repeat methyltransferase
LIDAHYENPSLAELYDLGNPWSVDRDFYVALAGSPRSRILDLGCGTGLLCDAYAALNHDVTGVDPSPAMLEIARRKPHGKDIEWVQSCAQKYQSGKLFDLIVMTGHAFQALLDDADVQATFTTMRKHLSSRGIVAFESRNPAIDWSARWNYDVALESPRGVVHESRRFVAMENERMTFELHFRFPDESFASRSELRFSSRTEIEARLTDSGLRAEKVLGDWDGKPFDEERSHEMIFIARAAS